jgi:hypothetical protein
VPLLDLNDVLLVSFLLGDFFIATLRLLRAVKQPIVIFASISDETYLVDGAIRRRDADVPNLIY